MSLAKFRTVRNKEKFSGRFVVSEGVTCGGQGIPKLPKLVCKDYLRILEAEIEAEENAN